MPPLLPKRANFWSPRALHQLLLSWPPAQRTLVMEVGEFDKLHHDFPHAFL